MNEIEIEGSQIQVESAMESRRGSSRSGGGVGGGGGGGGTGGSGSGRSRSGPGSQTMSFGGGNQGPQRQPDFPLRYKFFLKTVTTIHCSFKRKKNTYANFMQINAK